MLVGPSAGTEPSASALSAAKARDSSLAPLSYEEPRGASPPPPAGRSVGAYPGPEPTYTPAEPEPTDTPAEPEPTSTPDDAYPGPTPGTPTPTSTATLPAVSCRVYMPMIEKAYPGAQQVSIYLPIILKGAE